jgi:hypothetical protein
MYKELWYVGVKPTSKMVGGGAWVYNCDIFRTKQPPTNETHGTKYGYCYGGYETKIKAIEVAMFHNFVIDTPRQDPPATSRFLDGENIYSRLERLGWVRVDTYGQKDVFSKENRRMILPWDSRVAPAIHKTRPR